MDVYTTEQEQVEQIKKWLREYVPTVVVGAALGLAAIYGWRYWQGLETQKREAASTQYEAMLSQLADKAKRDEASKLGEKLAAEYGETAYADLTALHLAKVAVEQNKLDEAVKQLRAVLDSKQETLAHVARVRLARVLLAQNKGDEALTLLTSQAATGEFRTAYEETKGDIYKAQGKLAEARTAYQAAQSAKLKDVPENALLGMKLDDLAMAAPAPAGAAK